MSNQEFQLTGFEQRRIENLASPMLFRELVDFAAKACLVKPFEPRPYEDTLSEEARLIASLGIRGVGAALHITKYQMEPSDFTEAFEGEQRPIFQDDPFRESGFYSDEVHPELLHLAREFGQALLDEAYRSLGQDVFDKLKQYRQAATLDEREAVLDWLYKRLWVMNIKKRGVAEGEDTDDTFYHPIRLSPKVMGVYPNHNFNPTCLGASVIAASFFEQAGAKYLHAGVMETRQQDFWMQSAGVLRMLDDHAKEMNISLPDVIVDSLDAKADKIFDASTHNRGYHACTYVKVDETTWYQIDSNFQLTGALHEIYSEELDVTYVKLEEYRELAPGLELVQSFGVAQLPLVCQIFIEHSDETFLPDEDLIRTFLLGDDDESIAEKIKSMFVDPFFAVEREPRSDFAGECLATMRNFIEGNGFKDGVHNAITKYVFWEGSPLEVMARCRQDERFLEDRIKDIRALPLVAIGSYIVGAVNTTKSEDLRIEHTRVEVGLPAQRIGMAVLSDFAVHCDDRLPASFWISHWPSDVALTETMRGASRSNSQDSILCNNAKWLDGRLQYSNAYGMVNEFLSGRQAPSSDQEE